MRPHDTTLLALAFCVASAGAQQPTAATLLQIDDVKRATRSLTSTDAAHTAGFEPVLGWIPTMGVHWVSNKRMVTGRTFKLGEPAQLMFSPINGRDSLVGAAYAYLAPAGDTLRPATFASNPPWHEHPNLAPPGQTLVMLHVWFVPSLDGPFAGHNHNLPYWAAGLTPPNAIEARDPVVDSRIRKTAMLLAEVVDSTGLFPVLAAREPARTQLRALRDSARALVPEFASAQEQGDWSRWDRTAERAAALWEAVRTTYLDAVLVPERRPGVQRAMDEMTAPPNSAHHRHP